MKERYTKHNMNKSFCAVKSYFLIAILQMIIQVNISLIVSHPLQDSICNSFKVEIPLKPYIRPHLESRLRKPWDSCNSKDLILIPGL